MNITLNQTVFDVTLSNESEHLFTVVPGNDSRVVIEANTLYGVGAASVAWGSISGAITNQADLSNALAEKAPSTHTHEEIFPTTIDWANFDNVLFL